ncbi:hypothetical protein ACHAXS_008019 [Conticribra weissflogii]
MPYSTGTNALRLQILGYTVALSKYGFRKRYQPKVVRDLPSSRPSTSDVESLPPVEASFGFSAETLSDPLGFSLIATVALDIFPMFDFDLAP